MAASSGLDGLVATAKPFFVVKSRRTQKEIISANQLHHLAVPLPPHEKSQRQCSIKGLWDSKCGRRGPVKDFLLSSMCRLPHSLPACIQQLQRQTFEGGGVLLLLHATRCFAKCMKIYEKASRADIN